MSVSNNTIDDSNGVYAFDSSLSKAIKFWFILFSEILSMPCYIVLIYYYLAHKTMRQPLYNHAIIASLFVDLAIISIDLSCHLGFLRLGYIVPSIPAVCLIWQLVDYGFWYGDLFLKSWAAIERHILIFHTNMVNTMWKRVFIHYLPLLFVTFYTPIVYTYLIFFYPVEYTYDYTVLLCGGPYYYNGIPAWLIWYESLFHYVIPIFLMIVFSNALFLRVILKKRRLRVANGWRQYRKMTIQLFFVSVIYLFDLPYIIVTIVRWSGYPDFGTDVQGPYFYYVNYIPIILFPFAVLCTYPKLVQQIFFWKNQRRGTIFPMTVNT
jgi:hypothetical protein